MNKSKFSSHRSMLVAFLCFTLFSSCKDSRASSLKKQFGGNDAYFMALKDGAGLVKKYAMVNIQKYQNVAIGDTVSDCEKAYIKLLSSSGIAKGNTSESQSVTGTIERIAQSVIEGNSHFYLVLNGKDLIFDVPVQDYLEVVTLKEGDRVTISYVEGDPVCTVLGLEK